MFAALGTKVTVVESARAMLDFCDARDRRGAPVPPARARRRLPLRREGRRRSSSARTAPSRSSTAASRSPPTSSCTPPAARAQTEDLGSSARGSRPTSAAGSPSTPDYRTAVAHIYAAATSSAFRRSPRRRWSRAALASAHAFGRATLREPSCSRSGSTRSPRSARRPDRGGADRGGRALRGRRLALPRARARADPRRHPRDAEDPRLARDPERSWASTSSGPARRSSSTSVRR